MLKRNLLNLFLLHVYGSSAQNALIYSWRFLSPFEVIRSLPIALSHWVRVFRSISSPSFSLSAADSRARQARRQIYGFSWQWRKRRVAGGSWRICQAAADTRVHRLSGSKTAYPLRTMHDIYTCIVCTHSVYIYIYTYAHTHTHTERYFSRCITVHLFRSPWPTKLANQIRSRPSRRRRLEQPRKGSNLFAAGRIAGTVKSLPRHPATHIPLNTTTLNISPGGRKRLAPIRLSRVTRVCDDIMAMISAFEGQTRRVSGGDIQDFLAVKKNAR